MKQPTKNAMREQLALAADEIIHARHENLRLLGLVAAYEEYHEGMQLIFRPWYRRLLDWWRK